MSGQNKRLFVLFFIFVALLVFPVYSFAQNLPIKDTAITVVGTGGGQLNPPETPGGDGLGPGEFEIPFKCNLNYWSLTYPRHSPWSADINRGSGPTDHGDPVLASADGVVTKIYQPAGKVILRHEGNYYTSYSHMENISVGLGQNVRLGQQIGEIGDTGVIPGQYHLHVNHSKNSSPDNLGSRIQVCYKRYGCNPVSVATNDRWRSGGLYNKGCP